MSASEYLSEENRWRREANKVALKESKERSVKQIHEKLQELREQQESSESKELEVCRKVTPEMREKERKQRELLESWSKSLKKENMKELEALYEKSRDSNGDKTKEDSETDRKSESSSNSNSGGKHSSDKTAHKNSSVKKNKSKKSEENKNYSTKGSSHKNSKGQARDVRDWNANFLEDADNSADEVSTFRRLLYTSESVFDRPGPDGKGPPLLSYQVALHCLSRGSKDFKTLELWKTPITGLQLKVSGSYRISYFYHPNPMPEITVSLSIDPQHTH